MKIWQNLLWTDIVDDQVQKYGIIFCEQISWITRSSKWVRLAKCTWSCNYNVIVKLQMDSNATFMGPKIWKQSWSLVLSKGMRVQKIEVEIQKKIWFSLCPLSIFNTSLNVCTNLTLDFYNRIIKSNDAQQAAPWVVLRQLLLWEKAAWGSEEGLLLETFFPWSPPALKGRAHEIFRSNLSQLWWFPPTDPSSLPHLCQCFGQKFYRVVHL